LIILTGLIAGAYPAFFLSSLNPTRVLKGDLGGHSAIGTFRKILVFVQFTVSIFMIIATALINDQMEYLNNLNLGFDKENVITMQLPNDTSLNSGMEVFINDLKSESGVIAVCRSGMPTGGSGELMFRVEQNGELTERTVKMLFVDYGFVDVLGLDILEGRNFSKEFGTDAQQAFLVNQEAVKAFGWHGDPLGKRVQWGLMPNGQAANDGKVVGVVNDFNYLTLHDPLEPLILCLNPGGSQNLSVRLNASDPDEALSMVQSKWEEFAEQYPFDPHFLSDQLENNYANEKNMKDIFRFFALISIVIACIGLYALLSYAIENRRKEIGIRKVLGAAVWNITSLIAKDFFIILLIAFFVASPLGYLGMKEWLKDFAYQTPIQVTSFLISFFVVFTLYAVLVMVQSIRIANDNPVDSLRTE
jgi:putative ABC transport system permease protein